MSDTCRAWARFPGMTEPVHCERRPHPSKWGHRYEFNGDIGTYMTCVWTDDAPGLETGYEEEP